MGTTTSTVATTAPPASLDQHMIPYDDLQLDEKVGEGAHGTVWKGRWTSKQQVVAIKVLRNDMLSADEFVAAVRTTTALVADPGTPHVVHFYGACQQPQCIVMQYMHRASLRDVLCWQKDALDWSTKTRMAYQIVKAVNILHNATPTPIVHGSIRSTNFLVDRQLNIKVSD